MPMNASRSNTCVACPSISRNHLVSPKTHRLSAFTSLTEAWSCISDSKGHTITTTAKPLDARDVLQECRKHLDQKKNLVH